MQNRSLVLPFISNLVLGSLSFIYCTNASAVERAGNGGSAIVCPATDHSGASIETLDDYEGRTLWGFTRAPVSNSDDPVTLAKAYAQKLARFQPMRSNRMLAILDHFFENTKFLSGAELAILPDSVFLAFQAGCRIEQIAIQRQTLFPEDRFFNISQDLWSKLDVKGKASLLLHETIYKEASSRGSSDSRTSRYFNELISSTNMDTLNKLGFEAIASKIGFSETLPPEPLANLAKKIDALLLNRTVYRSETRSSGSADEIKTTYSDLLVGGEKLTFMAHEVEVTTLPENRRTLDRLFTVRLMKSTGELQGEVTLQNTDDYESTRGSSSGHFELSADGSLIWDGTTVGYGDRTDSSGNAIPVQEELKTSWNLQNGLLTQTSLITQWNYDPALKVRTSERFKNTLISKELKILY